MTKVNGRLRFGVLERDGFRCVYCGRTSREVELHVDHVIPRAAGGLDEPANLVTACSTCNQAKSDRLVQLPKHVDLEAPLPRYPSRRMPARRGVPQVDAATADRFDERFARYRQTVIWCDDCDGRADTVHWLPYLPLDGDKAGHLVKAGCPKHDPGGYWLYVADLFQGPMDFRFNNPKKRYTGWDHVLDKTGGETAIALLDERLGSTAPMEALVQWRSR